MYRCLDILITADNLTLAFTKLSSKVVTYLETTVLETGSVERSFMLRRLLAYTLGLTARSFGAQDKEAQKADKHTFIVDMLSR
jgi:hypothetical protein